MRKLRRRLALAALAGLLSVLGGRTVAAAPELAGHDLILKDFHFRSGETLPELKLHYRTLGTSGLLVSPICLGTMTFGTPVPENEAIRLLTRLCRETGAAIHVVHLSSAEALP